MAFRNEGGCTIITGEADTRLASMMVQRSALKLELKGLRRRGESVFSIVKRTYGLTGSKQKVFDRFNQIVEEAKAARLAAQLQPQSEGE